MLPLCNQEEKLFYYVPNYVCVTRATRERLNELIRRTFPISSQRCSARWGQIGASSSVWTWKQNNLGSAHCNEFQSFACVATWIKILSNDGSIENVISKHQCGLYNIPFPSPWNLRQTMKKLNCYRWRWSNDKEQNLTFVRSSSRQNLYMVMISRHKTVPKCQRCLSSLTANQNNSLRLLTSLFTAICAQKSERYSANSLYTETKAYVCQPSSAQMTENHNK